MIKGKKSFFSFEERKKLVESITYVDLVILESSWDQMEKDITEFKIDRFAIGEDWKGEFDNLKDYCEVIYLERTTEIYTTMRKNKLSKVENKVVYSYED